MQRDQESYLPGCNEVEEKEKCEGLMAAKSDRASICGHRRYLVENARPKGSKGGEWSGESLIQTRVERYLAGTDYCLYVRSEVGEKSLNITKGERREGKDSGNNGAYDYARLLVSKCSYRWEKEEGKMLGGKKRRGRKNAVKGN